MGRHGYVDDGDLDVLELGRWRGRVASAIRGKRGQALLVALRDALDSMEDKRLVSRRLQCADGSCCTLGRMAQVRGLDLLEYEEADEDDLQDLNRYLAKQFDIAECMVQEIEYENDEGGNETPEQRWVRMRRWVDCRIKMEARDASS